MSPPVAAAAMQWPPVHGGRIYWRIRGALFKAKRFNRRVIRGCIENTDRQRLISLMMPRYSYDNRMNLWTHQNNLKGMCAMNFK